LTEKPKSKKHKLLDMFSKRKGKEDEWEEEKGEPARNASRSEAGGEETGGKTHFCQCCGDKVNESMTIKICIDCFRKIKEI